MSKRDEPAFRLDRRKVGILGEETAAAQYRKVGYIILDANFHSRFGELDLVAFRDDVVVFVEVRTRDENAEITPAETVDVHKRRKLILAAQNFLVMNPDLNEFSMRFDVVEVFYMGGYNCRSNRIENAFSVK